MKTLIFLLITVSSFAQFRTAKIKSVYDGDTYYATVGGIFTTIRLINVDCPEVANKHTGKDSQEYSQEVKDSVALYLKGKEVKIRIYDNDRYGRTLAEVYVVNGLRRKSLSNMILEKGWGWVNTDYVKNPLLTFLIKKQEKAKKLKLGLWQFENPVEPKVFRSN